MKQLGKKQMIGILVGIILVIGVAIVSIVSNETNKKDISTKKIDSNHSGIEQKTNQTESEKTLDKVQMEIKEGSLTKTSATICITDNNEEPYTYEEWFRIDKKENGEWKEVKTIDETYAFNEVGIVVNENGKVEIQTDWSKLYGELEKGEYRLVKEQYQRKKQYYFWTEFTID